MATTYTSIADGPWDTVGTWDNGVTVPGAATDDIVVIATGHDITASAGNIHVAAITINGTGTLTWGATTLTADAIVLSAAGSFITGDGALTCTSITTTAANAGVVTIGAGGATFAGVLNNAGSGTLTINGVLTGVTAFTTGVCVMGANITCTSVAIPTGGTLTASGTRTLTVSASGAIVCTTTGTINFTGNASVIVCGSVTTTANMNLGTGVHTFAGTLTVAASTTLTCEGAGGITGMTANCGGTGTIVLGAGGVLTWDVAANVGTASVNITANGTSWSAGSFCTITNVNAGGKFTVGVLAAIWNVEYLDLLNVYDFRPSVPMLADNLNLDGATASNLIMCPPNSILTNSWISNNDDGRFFFNGFHYWLSNVTFGETRDGTSHANAKDIGAGTTGTFYLHGRNIQALSTTKTYFDTSKPFSYMQVDNWGYNPSHTAGTGTGTPGVGYYERANYSIERSISNPPSGKTYHARITQKNAAPTESYQYGTLSVFVPVITGDTLINVEAKAARSADTSDCADCWIDPEGAWFAGTAAVAWDLTAAGASGTNGTTNAAPGTTFTSAGGAFLAAHVGSYLNITAGTGVTPGQYLISARASATEITLATSPGASGSAVTYSVAQYYALPDCHAHTAGGTLAKGTVRVVFRCLEYAAAAYVDIGDVVITVTHADATTTTYTVSMQNWQNGMPTIDDPNVDTKAFLNTNKDEMIAANDTIVAKYGCDVGTAAGGGGIIVIED